MRLSSVFGAFALVAAAAAQIVTPSSEVYQVEAVSLQPMSPSFQELYDTLQDPALSKRDSFEDNLSAILKQLQASGVILDVLHEIAGSTEEMNTLANYIFEALLSISSGSAVPGLNVTVNVTEIIQTVNDSGIVYSALTDLFLNTTNREEFTDNLGEVLVNNTWIPKLIYTVGDTGDVSWETIFDLARNTKSKDPGFNGTSYTYKDYTQIRLGKRADNLSYSGSLLSFVNNLIGSALGSDLFDLSLSSILAAVDDSGIITPLVESVLADSQIQYMVGYIANKLYNYGVFDQIPLNDYFHKYKNNGVLTRASQKLFGTNPSAYVVAEVFLRWKQKGVMTQIRANLYGPSK